MLFKCKNLQIEWNTKYKEEENIQTNKIKTLLASFAFKKRKSANTENRRTCCSRARARLWMLLRDPPSLSGLPGEIGRNMRHSACRMCIGRNVESVSVEMKDSACLLSLKIYFHAGWRCSAKDKWLFEELDMIWCNCTELSFFSTQYRNQFHPCIVLLIKR